MDLRFDRNRMVASAAACIVGCVVGIVLLAAVLDHGAPAFVYGAVIGGTVATGLYGIVFLVHVVNAGKPVVTIDDRGIEFHRPEVGLVPWASVEKVEIEKVMGSKRFSVYVRPPAPRPGLATKLLYSLALLKRGGTERLTTILGRFDASEADIRAAVDRYRPAA